MKALRLFFVLFFASIAIAPEQARSEIRNSDLQFTRSIAEGEWLRLQLDLLALHLSFPAYRIDISLNEKNIIVFTFLSSSGLSDDMVKMGRADTEKMLKYHAEGISERVSTLIKDQFPRLWTDFDDENDFKGEFRVPGEDPEQVTRQRAYWLKGRLHWSQ